MLEPEEIHPCLRDKNLNESSKVINKKNINNIDNLKIYLVKYIPEAGKMTFYSKDELLL